MNEAVAVPEMTHSSNYFDQDRQLDGIPRKLLLTEPAPVALRAVDRRTPLDADTDEYERAASAELYRKYPTCRYSSTPLSTISVQQQYLADNELGHASFKQASYLEQGLPQCQKQLRKIRQHPLRDTSPHHRQRYSAPTSLSIDNGLYEEVEDDYQQPEDHALWILTYLSLINPFLAVIVALYALLILVLLTLLTAFRLCSTRAPLSSQLTTYLGPTLNLQFRMIYSSAAISASRSRSLFSTNVTAATAIADQPYDALMLPIILILSSVLCLPVAIASWIAAIFWFYAAVIGDPTPNGASIVGLCDGKATVMGVRNWWERCLVKSLREMG